MAERPVSFGERLVYRVVMALLWLLGLLPHRLRLRVAGAVMALLAGPLGQRRRVRDNLALVMPDLPQAEVRRIETGVARTIGHVFAEVFAPEDIAQAARAAVLEGPGVPALEEARAAGRPIILASGHFGNYEVFRVAMMQRGHDMGALYRPFNNRPFDDRYKATLLAGGGKLFARGREGLTEMVRHIRKGGTLGILHDQHMDRGEALTFFGKRAMTATMPAHLALKYDALLVPIYATREVDGTRFRLEAEAPIPHTDERAMMQALNDSLEARVRGNMDQWIWTHQRWKERKR
jgi:KDO2-lipid IV(A) lauroyltransferase